MKTQISKPAHERTRYTQEYKAEALSLWRAGGRSAAQVAAELGIRPPLLTVGHAPSACLKRVELGVRRSTVEELEVEVQR